MRTEQKMLPMEAPWKFFCVLTPPFRVEAANKIDPRYPDGFVIVDINNVIGGPYRFMDYEFAVERCELVNYNAAERIMVAGTAAEGI